MSILSISGLSQKFQDKALYVDSDFELYSGEHIGVVGQNGAGKSTFMRIITEEFIPDKGLIKWNSNTKVAHMDQYAEVDPNIAVIEYLKSEYKSLYEIERKMMKLYESSTLDQSSTLKQASKLQDRLTSSDFYEIDIKIDKMCTGLGIDAIGYHRQISTLSGGQRAKVILAKLLLSNPDVLLLDEPTNFLDKEHIAWLSDYLNNFKGAFIIVSHDFQFLEKITTCICDIEFGTIKKYYGKYSEFLKQKTHMRTVYLKTYQSQLKKIEKMESFIQKNIAGTNSKIAQGRRKQLAKIERIQVPKINETIQIHLQEAPIVSQIALSVDKLEIGYHCPLLPPLTFNIQSNKKIVITGFNGIGKSTLLKTLMNEISKLSGSFEFFDKIVVGYYEQDLNWEDDQKTPIQIISDLFPKLTSKEIRTHLAQQGIKKDLSLQSIRNLSGGEQSKVKLSILLLKKVNFLVLDEPTNHLDEDTKNSLQKAFINFKGGMILVSHEEKFYKNWIDEIWNIEKIKKEIKI